MFIVDVKKVFNIFFYFDTFSHFNFLFFERFHIIKTKKNVAEKETQKLNFNDLCVVAIYIALHFTHISHTRNRQFK